MVMTSHALHDEDLMLLMGYVTWIHSSVKEGGNMGQHFSETSGRGTTVDKDTDNVSTIGSGIGK